jgi:flagellar FliL protein
MSAEASTRPTAAPAAARAAAAEPAEQAAPKPKAPVRLYALVGLVLLAALGGGGWFFAARFRTPGEVEVKREAPVKATVSLGSVVVNIGPTESRRYLKVGVELGVPDAKVAKEVEEHKAQILDLLISVLATSSLDVLGSEEGRSGVKKSLIERIHEELELEKVSRVYFTEFMIQ